jgi:hypothetical protein
VDFPTNGTRFLSGWRGKRFAKFAN